MTFKHVVLSAALIGILSSCAKTDAPRVSTTEVTEVALADVPDTVKDIVSAARPDFKITDVLKKVRDGRTYYDVEGVLLNGDEIEFDVLMTKSGPEIVEIQRDLAWETVPTEAQQTAKDANKKNEKIIRIIESVQTDSSIIYEIFVEGHPSDPRFEVQMKDGKTKLLPTRWKH